MKIINRIHLIVTLALLTTVSCDDNVGETIESSFLENVWVEPVYKFSRNGSSSVDIQECEFLKEPIDYFYNSFLRKANLKNEASWVRAKQYYEEGEYGLKPKEELCSSTVHRTNRIKVIADFDSLIESSKRIAGFYEPDTNGEDIRMREAAVGKSGYIGLNIADENILYADDQGLVVSEQFKYAIMGAVYLDKILNLHLNEEVIFSGENCTSHDNLELVRGKNYTQVEHHLDLAKGYYEYWKPLAVSDGITALKESDRKILYAFVEARRLLIRSRYDLAREQLQIIKRELSKVVGVRAMNSLIGPNTLVNMQENPKYAFGFISKACGLIYALQFTTKEDGTPFFTYDEVKALTDELRAGVGFWDKERLLANENRSGSLKNIAAKIGIRFGVALNEIEK